MTAAAHICHLQSLLGQHNNIVKLIDSQYTCMNDGRYEVLICMEYCSGGHLVDLMNRRLDDRLQEGEILFIFHQVCNAVAFMHYQQPPIMFVEII